MAGEANQGQDLFSRRSDVEGRAAKLTKKLEVLLLSQQGAGIGGAERVALTGLARATGLSVTVVAPARQCEFAGRLGLRTVEMELPRLRSKLMGPVRLAAGSIKVARLAKRLRAEVIYANAIRAMGYAIGARLLGGPPVVAHQHHMLSPEDKHHIEGGIFNRDALVRSLERWADVIVVPSGAAARPFNRSPKIRVIPNGIDLEAFVPAPDRHAAKNQFGLGPDSPVVGTVTRADPDKGMKSFLSLAERISISVPNAEFLLAGGASFPHEIGHYAAVVERAGEALGNRLSLPGHLDDPVPAYHAMDVMVHTSDQAESFGLTVVEAMACRLPVVAYDWGGVSEVVGEGSGLLVAPGDEPAAAQAVLRLLHDPDLRRTMGAAGRKRCEQKYRLEDFTEAMTATLASVA